MSISHQDVTRISNLARIELTKEEKSTFEKELSAIFDFIQRLNSVDTIDIVPMAGGTIEKNVMRLDDRIETDLEGKASDLVAAVPEKKEEWVKVKAIFS